MKDLPGKHFGLLATDSLQRWELSGLAGGCGLEVTVQDRLNNAPTWTQQKRLWMGTTSHRHDDCIPVARSDKTSGFKSHGGTDTFPRSDFNWSKRSRAFNESPDKLLICSERKMLLYVTHPVLLTKRHPKAPLSRTSQHQQVGRRIRLSTDV